MPSANHRTTIAPASIALAGIRVQVGFPKPPPTCHPFSTLPRNLQKQNNLSRCKLMREKTVFQPSPLSPENSPYTGECPNVGRSAPPPTSLPSGVNYATRTTW